MDWHYFISINGYYESLLNQIRDQYLHIILKLGVNEDMERHMNKSKSFDFIEFINLLIK